MADKLDVATLEKLMKKAAPKWKDMANPPTDKTVSEFRQFAALVILKQVKEALMQHGNPDDATTAKVALGFDLEITAAPSTATTSTADAAGSTVTLRCTRYGWPDALESSWTF
ncbi:MAG: hypothetical protein ACX94B_08575 [Henriciella sp.]